MNAPLRLRLTPEDYLRWESTQERKHELVGGEVRAMAGATRAHNEIAGSVYAELRALLRGGPCRPYGSDMKVAIPNRNYRYPDVVIDCAKGAPGDLFAAEPTVVFEVLSPSTEFFDETDKLADYQSTPSIRQIVLLSQQRPHARSFVRDSEGWRALRHEGLGADIPLAGFDVLLPLARIYAGVEWAGGVNTTSS